MSIGDMLAQQARARPDSVAIIDARDAPARRITYAQLEQQVSGAAAWLRSNGLKRGDAVLVFVPMSAELYVALLAMFRLGVVALFLDPSAGRGHIERCCVRWPPQAMLAVRKAHWLRVMSAALRRIPLKIAVGGWFPGARRFPRRWANGSEPGVALSGDEPALVTFTSGSTGAPKAAVRTHGFLLAQHRALAPSIALEAGEVDLATLPVFALANLASGVTTVISGVDLARPGAVDASQIFHDVESFGVTRITASPAFFERLIEHGRKTGQTLPRLRTLHTGGAPVFPRVLDGMRAVAPNADVVAVYGSTEAEPIAHVRREEITDEDRAAMRNGRGLLAGHVVDELSLRVVRDRWGEPRGAMDSMEFEREVLARGEVGEIVVTGDHVLKGYLGGVGDAETKFAVNDRVWHRTGDAGFLDEARRLWLLGRCAARIDDARGRLYPFGVECVAMMFPDVKRAAVIASGGKRWLVVETENAGPELERGLGAATAWAQIDGVHFIEHMPLDKRHNAKIDYPALRAWLDVIGQAER